MATAEAPIHDNVKRRIVESDERSTDLLYREFRNTARVARNAVSQQIRAIEDEPTSTFADIADLASSARARQATYADGDVDGSVWTVGQAQGLIHDIPSCAELVSRIVAQAREVIRGRLDSALAWPNENCDRERRTTAVALYLEDLAADQQFTSAGRTITESDVTAFAGLSGDFNPIHADAEFARGSVYGQRVVFGLLGLSIATGLLDRLAVFSGSAIAMLGIKEWTFSAPIFIGDTVHLELTILAVRPSRSKSDRGVVERLLELKNQSGELTQSGRIDLLVRRRPALPPATAGT